MKVLLPFFLLYVQIVLICCVWEWLWDLWPSRDHQTTRRWPRPANEGLWFWVIHIIERYEIIPSRPIKNIPCINLVIALTVLVGLNRPVHHFQTCANAIMGFVKSMKVSCKLPSATINGIGKLWKRHSGIEEGGMCGVDSWKSIFLANHTSSSYYRVPGSSSSSPCRDFTWRVHRYTCSRNRPNCVVNKYVDNDINTFLQ